MMDSDGVQPRLAQQNACKAPHDQRDGRCHRDRAPRGASPTDASATLARREDALPQPRIGLWRDLSAQRG